jgi:O-antigen/teichoic acid export membrane protein
MGERIFAALLGLVVVAVVARHLGPADFGLLSYAFALASLFAIVGHLGLDSLIVRELVLEPEKATNVLGTVFTMKVAAYLLAALALLVYTTLLKNHSQTEVHLLYLAAASIALAPAMTFTSWFHAKVLARYVSISGTLALLVAGFGKLALVFVGAGVIAIAAMNVVQIVFAAAIGIFFYIRIKGPPLTSWEFSPEAARALLSESWMIFLGSIFAVIYLKIDQVMLRWLVGPQEVGVYAVAAQLSEAAYFIPTAIVASVFPKLIELRKTDEVAFHLRLQTLFDLLALAALAVLLSVLLLGESIVTVIFGAPYYKAVPILVVHILAVPFIFLRFAFSKWIIIEEFAVFSLITQGLGALMNVVLNMVLIPYIAGLGAAMATVASYATASYFALLFSRKTRPIFKMMSSSIFMPWRGVQRLFVAVRT